MIDFNNIVVYSINKNRGGNEMLLKHISKSEKRMIHKILELCLKLNEVQEDWTYSFNFGLGLNVHKYSSESDEFVNITCHSIYHKNLGLDLRPNRLKNLIERLKGELEQYEGDRHSK